MEVNPCRRLEVGGTLYGHVRCRDGLVAVRSGAAIVTFREGTLTPGDVGLCARSEFGFNEIPVNGGLVNDLSARFWLNPLEARAPVHSGSSGCNNSIPPSLKPNMVWEDRNELGRLPIILAGSICLYESTLLKELKSEFILKDEGTDNDPGPEYNPEASKERP